MLAPAPASLTDIAARTEACLRRVLDEERARWAPIDEVMVEPVDEIARLVLGGGKRLRPAFVHWGYVGAGGEQQSDIVIRTGAAFELMHAFALFHDDVMDDAPTRRGLPTTHALYSQRHAEHGWLGQSRRFGEGAAILIGDLAFVFADRLLHDANPAAWAVWNELRIELNLGQFLDITGSARNDRRLTTAQRICRYKSGKYTIERPLHMGALLAAPERADELLPALSAYGLPLGDAFQMRDDVMGAFGDPAVTGKPVGGDLREGKSTPLMAMAIAAANDAQRAVLATIGRPDLTDDDVQRVQEAIVASGALAAHEAQIDALVSEATDAVARAPIAAEARDELLALAAFVSQRNM